MATVAVLCAFLYTLPLEVRVRLAFDHRPAAAPAAIRPAPAHERSRVVRVTPQSARDAWVAPDKFRHFFAAYSATSFGYATLRSTGVAHGDGLVLGVLGAVAASALKEIADARRGGRASAKDLAWDLLGIGAAVLVLEKAR